MELLAPSIALVAPVLGAAGSSALDVSTLAALVAACVTAALLALRELVVLAMFSGDRRARREDDAAALERDGFALLRAGEDVLTQCQRFLHFSRARWYSDPLDPGLKNALNYQLTVFFARLRGLSAATFLEFAPRSDRLRTLGDLAEALYDAITEDAPAGALSMQAQPLGGAPGVLRRHDVHLLAERAWRDVGPQTEPLSYGEFLEQFVDLGVGPRSELTPLIGFLTAAERVGARRLQLVRFTAALATFNAVLARQLGARAPDPAAWAIPGADELDPETWAALRKRSARLGVKLTARVEDNETTTP